MLYFSHPVKTYNTLEEALILEALEKEYPEHKILNPASLGIPSRLHSCRECMGKDMKTTFFPLIERADVFAIWAPISSCGVRCELTKAWELEKPIIYTSLLPDRVEFESLTLQEYHLIASLIEVE